MRNDFNIVVVFQFLKDLGGELAVGIIALMKIVNLPALAFFETPSFALKVPFFNTVSTRPAPNSRCEKGPDSSRLNHGFDHFGLDAHEVSKSSSLSD
jgi:hypothetical protein